MIFCIKLYKIQFTIKTKNKESSDDSKSIDSHEEEEKLIYYISKKCISGIKPDKQKSFFEKMKKYKNFLENNDKYKDYLQNLL